MTFPTSIPPARRHPRIGEVWMYAHFACLVTQEGFVPLNGVTKINDLDLAKATFLAESVEEAERQQLLDGMPGRPIPYYLISKKDAETVRAALTGAALHTFDSGLHVTPFAPFDHSGPVDAKTFADEVLNPVATLANDRQIAFFGLAVGVAFDEEEETLAVSNIATVTQLGYEAEYRVLLKDVLGETDL